MILGRGTRVSSELDQLQKLVRTKSSARTKPGRGDEYSSQGDKTSFSARRRRLSRNSDPERISVLEIQVEYAKAVITVSQHIGRIARDEGKMNLDLISSVPLFVVPSSCRSLDKLRVFNFSGHRFRRSHPRSMDSNL